MPKSLETDLEVHKKSIGLSNFRVYFKVSKMYNGHSQKTCHKQVITSLSEGYLLKGWFSFLFARQFINFLSLSLYRLPFTRLKIFRKFWEIYIKQRKQKYVQQNMFVWG